MSDNEYDETEDESTSAWPTLYVDGDVTPTGWDYGEDLRVQVEHVDVSNGYEVTGPLSWLNSAALDLDYSQDSASVSLSVGDPRGAFVFTVRRLEDGTMILHTPYPSESLPHMTLTEIRPGTYQVGAS